MRKLSRLLVGAVLCGILAAPSADASDPATATLFVTAEFEASCTALSAPLLFGNIPAGFSSPVMAQTSFTVNCTAGTSALVTLDQGMHPSSSSTAAAPARQLQSTTGGTLVPYNLTVDSEGTMPWGNSTTFANMSFPASSTYSGYTGSGFTFTTTPVTDTSGGFALLLVADGSNDAIPVYGSIPVTSTSSWTSTVFADSVTISVNY